ncbi:MAG: 4-(cytidine 5'-diphospho)-2-C-methyl-D-erythritol kinase [Flavobacteriales bacterium]
MVFFPPAKLNLGLHITGKRDDGFHNLESVFLPIDWSDILEVILDEEVPQGQARFEWTGLAIPGNPDDNLVTRAHKRLAEAFDLPGVSIHLHKVLPMGGGVGGGSADGTYTLRALNEVCNLGLSQDALMAHAAELGSDCPFFVQDAPALVRGRGEIVKPLQGDLPLQGWWVVVANPGIHISTAEAFGDVTPTPRPTDWNALSTLPVSAWRDVIQNDFEVGARQRHPEVGRLIDALAEAGAAHAQMTGSGSTVFGLFEREGIAREAARLTQAQFCGPIFRDC